MTENIEYNEILEVSDDKGVIHLVIESKKYSESGRGWIPL